MLRLKTSNKLSFLMIKNPNDSLDFISSIQSELNHILEANDERDIKKIKITYGATKETSEQVSKQYEGVKGFAFLKKKALSAGSTGYFSGSRDRWKYTTFDKKGNERNLRYFDNHFKINFKCKSIKEREILKTLVMVLLSFYSTKLKCAVCDLDYMEDIEAINDELYEFNVYIYARTCVEFSFDDNQEPFKKMGVRAKIMRVRKKEHHHRPPKEPREHNEEDFENGFF